MKKAALFSIITLCLISLSCYKSMGLRGRYYSENSTLVEYVEFMKDGKCEIKNNLLKTVKEGKYEIKDDVVIIDTFGQNIILNILSSNELETDNFGWKGKYIKK